MDNKTAVQIINEALHIAITKGAFGLVEVSNVVKAIETINALFPVETSEVDHQDIKSAREKEL
jgi:hypothetical protein